MAKKRVLVKFDVQQPVSRLEVVARDVPPVFFQIEASERLDDVIHRRRKPFHRGRLAHAKAVVKIPATGEPIQLVLHGRYPLPITVIVMIDRDFMRGFVKLYTLWRASRSEVYGIQIMLEMKELGFNLSPGTLYPALHALLNERDVVVTVRTVKGKIRKCYRATAKGRKELGEVRERLQVLMRKIF